MIFGIGDGLNKNRFCPFVDCCSKGFGIRIRHPLDADTKVLESYWKNVVAKIAPLVKIQVPLN